MSGKGSSPRPMPNREQFDKNFDAIFNKHKEDKKPKDKKDKNNGSISTVYTQEPLRTLDS